MTTATVRPQDHFKGWELPKRTKTNDEHVEILLNELPHFRAALLMLSLDDQAMEAKLRAGTVDDLHRWLNLVENWEAILHRHRAGIEILESACARVLAVVERVSERGTSPTNPAA